MAATLRVFEWFQFGALVCWGFLGLSRALLLHSRGVPVFAANRRRTVVERALDLLAAACLLLWAYEVVAYAWQFDIHIGPAGLHRTVIDSSTIRTGGVIAVVAGLVLYGVALRRLGESWRLGIDKATPGPLVTSGIYGWTRHPIYIAFDILFIGTFLVLGRPIFLALLSIWVPLLHLYMLREEHFLTQLFGPQYREYSQRVGRYFSWRRSGQTQ